MPESYDQRLARLRMPRPDTRGGGLVSTERHGGQWPKWLTIEETAALNRARKHGANHVFFRRFPESGRASIPQAYVFDNMKGGWSRDDLTKLQWELWNSHEVPLCFIFQPDNIDILSCWTKPEFFDATTGQKAYRPNDAIVLAGDVQAELDKFNQYSGDALENGSFWDDQRNAKLADRAHAAHDSLIKAIIELDEELSEKRILPEPLRRKLLVICLMLKYLEDREVLDAADFAKFRPGAKQLFQVLESAKSFVGLLEAQAKRFNGDVFQLSSEEKQLLRDRDAELGRFAGVLDGKTSNRQMHLWKLYSFEHLPVEVISYIYQRFVRGAVGAVYTPPFLVDFLLGEAMPYAQISDDFRVIDPACGSGVFLVAAFKRLVNSWRYSRGWRRAGEAVLKRKLKEIIHKIHGVDADPFAVELTVFSLSLALCDQLEPKQIRRHFQFDILKGITIHQQDFFEFLPDADQRKERWQLVIGNPPFETSHLTPAAKAIEAEARVERAGEDGEPIETPYHQLAFLFLEQSLCLTAKGGTVCLLVPSVFLYGVNSADFRASVFRRWRVPQIVDFTSIRNLFPEGDTKCCAVFVESAEPTLGSSLLHITPRRTTATKEGLFFEIDAYDFHRVGYSVALSDSSIWKANLLGGGRVHSIVRRLLDCDETLASFVTKRVARGWISHVGFIQGKRTAYQPAEHLTEKPHLPTKAFTRQGIDEARIVPLKAKLFKDPANPKQFEPPAILFRLLDTLPTAIRHDYLTYRDDIVGIKAPTEDTQELEWLHSDLVRLKTLHRFFVCATAPQMFVGKATVPQKYDVDRLPLFSEKQLAEPLFSQADMAVVADVVDCFGYFVRVGQDSPLLQKSADDDDLDRFAEQFLSLVNPIYRKFRRNRPVRTPAYVCLQFSYGGPPQDELRTDEPLNQALRRLLHRKGTGVLEQRILRLYSGNTVYLIKPNRLRYWIPSVAVRDADETVAELASRHGLAAARHRTGM
ncbi:MAG: N-6 DNA methylase [Verrucomicrobia bacterium]|nr:N-6 DNA methylase [Verrucomicrobiota bacterium]